MVECSGLENLAGKAPETAGMAGFCGLQAAQDALFTERSEARDGNNVGTVCSLPTSQWTAPAFVADEPSEAEHRRLRLRLGASDPDAGYTYFAGPERRFLIKIGRSCEPWRRARELSNEVCHPIRVIATLRGDFELNYHRLFADHRAFGEWFLPHPNILAEIERLATPIAGE